MKKQSPDQTLYTFVIGFLAVVIPTAIILELGYKGYFESVILVVGLIGGYIAVHTKK